MIAGAAPQRRRKSGDSKEKTFHGKRMDIFRFYDT